MIKPVIDTKFADAVSSRYLSVGFPLLPADMIFLQQETEEETQSPASKYETYIQNINQITQNTEENLIVNLKLDFHFLHKMFSKTLPPMTVPKKMQKSFLNNPEKVLKGQLHKPELKRQLEPVLQKELAPLLLKNEQQQQPPQQPQPPQPAKAMREKEQQNTPRPVQAETAFSAAQKAKNAQAVMQSETVHPKKKDAQNPPKSPEQKPIEAAAKKVTQAKKAFPKAPDTLHSQEASAQQRQEPAGLYRQALNPVHRQMPNTLHPQVPDALHPQTPEKAENQIFFSQAERVLAQPEEKSEPMNQSQPLPAEQPSSTTSQGQQPGQDKSTHGAVRSFPKAEPNQQPAKKEDKLQSEFRPVQQILAQEDRAEKISAEIKESFLQKETQSTIRQKQGTAQNKSQAQPTIKQKQSRQKAQPMQQRAEEYKKMVQFAQQWAERQKPMLEKAAAGKTGEHFYPFVRAAILHHKMESTPGQAASALAQLQRMTAEKAAQTQPALKSASTAQVLSQQSVTESGQAARQAVQQLLKWDNQFTKPAQQQARLVKPNEKMNSKLLEPMQLRYPEGVTTGSTQPEAEQFTESHRSKQKASNLQQSAQLQYLRQNEPGAISEPQKTAEPTLLPEERISYRNGVQAVEKPAWQTQLQTVYKQTQGKQPQPVLQSKVAAALTGRDFYEIGQAGIENPMLVYSQEAEPVAISKARQEQLQKKLTKKAIPPLSMVYRREREAVKPEEKPQEEINDIQTIQKVVRETKTEKLETVQAINAPPPIMAPVPAVVENTTVQVNQIADQVYNLLERRLRFENIRKGGF